MLTHYISTLKCTTGIWIEDLADGKKLQLLSRVGRAVRLNKLINTVHHIYDVFMITRIIFFEKKCSLNTQSVVAMSIACNIHVAYDKPLRFNVKYSPWIIFQRATFLFSARHQFPCSVPKQKLARENSERFVHFFALHPLLFGLILTLFSPFFTFCLS